MAFNEDSRVKIPALLHFLRLEYTYQTKKKQNINPHNNIFVDVFKQSIRNINGKDYTDEQLDALIKEIETLTENRRDKGKSFYERLVNCDDIMLINFEDITKNDFRVVSELTFKGERDIKFRPDITILINGIPLGFIEVKKPNNINGIQAEFDRMKNERLCRDELVPFFNQLQVLGFTNNQWYDDDSRTKKQGSYYTTPNGTSCKYNHFREEQRIAVSEYISDEDMNAVLSDNNVMSIKSDAEFHTNLKPDTPCNSFITSVFSKERIMFFLQYGIVYVDSPVDGFNKHIIRYPQYFALQELKKCLKDGMKRGVLWHTQGSGKTAFAYFATNVLRDYYQEKEVITKFYFVVDRLDLLNQAKIEFSARGMTIAEINSQEDFVKNMASPVVMDNSSQKGIYKETMNIVNIQKFTPNSKAMEDADTVVQRIYFMDEVHRGYKPKGTFLGNLLGSDPNGIFIGLTGTPILETVVDEDGTKHSRVKRNFKTTDLFCRYIHKYYYNKSIADGYTLKIKKENIDTKFRTDLRAMLDVPEGQTIPEEKWKKATKSEEYVDQLCKYIIDDFTEFEKIQNDDSMGFMIVSSSTEQARAIQKWFEDNRSEISTALVLCDEEDNKEKQDYFRGKRDNATGDTIIKYKGVIVFDMLLTGFDAPRLKRLYLLRTVREHNLLQTLARVNRPYKNMRYGYVVDFVDITEEYEETNRRYLEELRSDIADDDMDYDDFFVDVPAVRKKIADIENALFIYMGNIENNLESFRKQIEPLDEKTVREIDRMLVEYRECYNELRMAHENVDNIPIDRITKAHYETSRRIDILVAERILNSDDDTNDDGYDFTNLIVEFLKNGELDLEFTTENDILEILNRYNNAKSSNTDKKDPVFKDIDSRYKQAIRDFKKEGNTTAKVKVFMDTLNALVNEMNILNENNNSLTNRYLGSEEYMRIHKRIVENYSENMNDMTTYKFMQEVIAAIDDLLGGMAAPSQNVVMRELLKPTRDALRRQGFTDVSKRQVENIVYLFIDDKFSN